MENTKSPKQLSQEELRALDEALMLVDRKLNYFEDARDRATEPPTFEFRSNRCNELRKTRSNLRNAIRKITDNLSQ